MRRRDLTIVLAASATSAFAARNAVAQSCTSPCYVATAAEIGAGVTPTNTTYPPGDIRRYGADPTGAFDSTTAIQNALNVAQAVYIPPGQYTITTALTNNISKRRIYGDGAAVSVLRPSGAINTLVNAASLSGVLMSDFAIFGDATTLDGITQAAGTTVAESRFENLEIYVGGRAFYLFWEFNTQLINCQCSSYNGNVFELNGGNTTLLQGCYAHQVPAGRYGYRIYCSGHLDSCCGIDSSNGGDWGLFGANTNSGDPTNANFNVIVENCDVEDFNSIGLRFRGSGVARIQGGAITAKSSGTYQAEIYVEYTGGLIVVDNVVFYEQGATRTAKAAIYVVTDSNIVMIGNCTAPQFDWGGTLVTLPVVSSTYPGYLQRAVNINSLDVSQLYNRYAGTATLSSGHVSVTFAQPQWDANYCVLVTGNVIETFSVTSKSTSGFTITSSNAASAAKVDWMAVRPGT